MADHGEVEYATATGNDYVEHEATYEWFVHATFIGICHVVSVLIALALGGVLGHWIAAGVIIVLATIVAAVGLWSGSRISSGIMLVISLLALLLYSTSA